MNIFFTNNALFCSGDETGGETPVLIPNTAVKTSRGDGTALCGRVARRQYKGVRVENRVDFWYNESAIS